MKNKICSLITIAFVLFCICGCSGAISARAAAPITPLANYSVAASDITSEYKYVNYTSKNASNVQTQSLFYGELNIKSTANKYQLVQHSIQSSSGGFTLHSVMDLALDYERKSGNQVMFAANGTFFYWDKGDGSKLKPNFAFMRDGELVKQTVLSDWSVNTGIGWNNSGEVVIGAVDQHKPSLQLVDEKGSTSFAINKINETPFKGELAIYKSGSFTIGSKFNAYKIPITKKINRELLNGGTPKAFTAMYGGVPVKVDGAQVQVSADEFYAVAEKNSIIDGQLSKLKGNCNFIATPSGRFDNVTNFAGGNNTLVKGGVVQPIYPSGHESQLAGRTTIGFKADGTPFISVSDGRQPGYANGITVMEQARLAGELGAQTAVELDGGGSSTFIMRQNNSLVMLNTPDDKDEVGRPEARTVIDAVLLVKLPSTAPDPIPPPDPPIPPDPIDPTPKPTPKNGCASPAATAAILTSVALMFIASPKK